MFNNTNGYSLSDIAAATGGNRDDNFGLGGNGAWIFLFFILFLAGGWGNGNGFGNNGGNGNAVNTIGSDVQRGFDQSALMNSINGLTNATSAGFSAAEVSRCNMQANILQTMNNNQASTSAQMNNNQIATMAQLNNMALNQLGYEGDNKAILSDLKYTIATENCADRTAIADALRDILTSNTANTQIILDKLCQQEIDALKAQNQQLQMQSYLATLAASQNAQTGQLLTALNPSPVPAYIVGNPNGCNCGNNGGCGGNGFYN